MDIIYDLFRVLKSFRNSATYLDCKAKRVSYRCMGYILIPGLATIPQHLFQHFGKSISVVIEESRRSDS